MIAAGAAIVEEYEWVLYLFAAFLIFTGIRMLMAGEGDFDVSANPVFKFMSKTIPRHERTAWREIHRQADRSPDNEAANWITPLLLALVMVELADVIFAVDSIPAISPSPPTPTCLHIEYLRHSWPACAVFRARKPYSSLRLPEIRIVSGAGFHRRKDFRRRCFGTGKDTANVVTVDHAWHPACRNSEFALENAA